MTGAALRAILMIVLVATPALLVPGVAADTAQVIVLLALFAGALAFAEYSATYPGLIEFRYAPPFNRTRFASLFLTILMLSLLIRGQYEPTTFTMLLEAVAGLLARMFDVPFSPVRLLLLSLPDGLHQGELALVRLAATLANAVALGTLVIFILFVRLRGWPLGDAPFNVWVNLPTFDPTIGRDVVRRLERDARFNISLGILMPFLLAAIARLATEFSLTFVGGSSQTLIWVIAAWAFLPASLIMRGVAMARVARLIRDTRRRSLQEHDEGAPLPA